MSLSPSVTTPRRSLALLAAALAGSLAVALTITASGGVDAFQHHAGRLAPLLTVPAHVALTLTPIGEVIPFGAANGALYGLALGAVLNWTAWMLAAGLQRAVGVTATREGVVLPGWLARLPLTHPAVLVAGRWAPGGGVLVDAAAGAAGVPLRQHLALAALGHAPQAVLIAAVGAGLVHLL